MSFLGRYGALGALAIVGLVAVGCGGTVIDDVKTEAAIESNVEKSLKVKVSSVDCPSDVDVKPGERFQCTVVMGDGEKQVASLKVINEDADVEFLDLSPQGK